MNGIEQAWNFVWNKLYDSRTSMFYNYLVGNGPEAATYHLPAPELIQKSIPNPNGYGISMEDCMLNAGMMLDAVLARYYVTSDSSMSDYAQRVYRGMELCATVSPQKGFLPRGVTPEDGISHYIDTSRDQYTNWIYGAFRLYFSPLADEKIETSIRKCLTAMADKFEAEVVEENNWSFLREDGKIGMHGKMWGDILSHEFLRLPMLYLLTWKTTNDTHWKDMYMRYRDEALVHTSDFVPLSGATYVGLQLQYSVRLVYELDEDPEVKQKCLDFMNLMAEPYETHGIKRARDLMEPERADWLRIKYIRWDQAKAEYAGYIGGLPYFCPKPCDFQEQKAYYTLRAVGEGIKIAALCPNRRVSSEAVDVLKALTEYIDFDDHYTCAPIALINAYWSVLEE